MADADERVRLCVGWFGPRLRELRVDRGFTQGHLAKLAGMSQPRVAEYESGRYAPSWEAVVRLSLALGCSADAFLRPPAAPEKSGTPIDA